MSLSIWEMVAELTNVKRPEVAQRIHDAKEYGDVTENAEYEDAKNEQAFVEGRIQTLTAIIKNAVIIDEKHSRTYVQIGSTVTIEGDAGKEKYTIVGAAEAAPDEGRISNESPVGRALLGKKKGEEVTVTVPASFDPAARELTAEAARAAGYERVTVLEEPQAALYSWIQASEGAWREQVQVGDIILVVDVGGGTTDLSLIAVIESDGNLELHRIAVGDHILLGGDNMDLALAHVVAGKLAAQGTQLDPWQIRALTHGCRSAKELLLVEGDTDAVPIVVPSRGSRLIGSSIRTDLTREEVTATLVEGFFPQVQAGARPLSRPRTGLTQLGLPYAQDAAITRHLAAFLTRQIGATADLAGIGAKSANASFLHPTAVLFNGGVFKSALLADRIMDILNGWLNAEAAAPARRLEGANLDLAVARGAAYYGYVRRGGGVRIRGGTAQAYYVGVESALPAVPGIAPPVQALCVAPFGMEEGSAAELPPQEFGLVVGEPVRFRFFGSSVRRQDEVGTRLDQWAADELQELGEIELTLPAEGRTPGEIVPVKLRAAVSEAGTLRLEAIPRQGAERWQVEFDVRS